jgi:hypothetical protein
MDRESPDLGVSVTAAARRPMAPLPIDSVRRGRMGRDTGNGW